MQVSDDESAMIAAGLQPVHTPRDAPIDSFTLPPQDTAPDTASSDSDDAHDLIQATNSHSAAKVSYFSRLRLVYWFKGV